MRVGIIGKTDTHTLSIFQDLAMKTGFYYEVINDVFSPPSDFEVFVVDTEFVDIGKIDHHIFSGKLLVLSNQPSFEIAKIAMRKGARDILLKPVNRENLWDALSSFGKVSGEESPLSRLPGVSKAIKEIREIIKKVAPTNVPVLIIGENGTEVDDIAKIIHEESERRGNLFVTFDCSVIPSSLIKKELFGTGENGGIIKSAKGGTVYIKEITVLPIDVQEILLGLLEKNMVNFDDVSYRADVRIICSSSFDPNEAVKRGIFREDLFYRLSTISILLPPLRERLEDIEPILINMLKYEAPRLGKKARAFSPGAIGMMKNYHWPGNIQELKSVLEQILILLPKDKERIEEEDLPLFLERRSEERKRRFLKESIQKQLTVEEYIKKFIETFQDEYTDREIAQMLGVTPKTVWEKRKKWNMLRRVRRARLRSQ